jgi:hypothetical protein
LIGYDVGFLLAGEIACDSAMKLSKLSNVRYFGRLSNAEALSLYCHSDFVFTYYAPDSCINRMAESNKWGDAIKLGVGIIVNSEVVTANYLRSGGAAASFEYADSDSLSRFLMSAAVDSTVSNKYKEASLLMADKFSFYEESLAIFVEDSFYV